MIEHGASGYVPGQSEPVLPPVMQRSGLVNIILGPQGNLQEAAIMQSSATQQSENFMRLKQAAQTTSLRL